MYGLVNKSIKEFVIIHFGNEVWEEINKELQLSETQFISLESNPDHITLQIMNHVCQKTGSSQSELAEELGEYFLGFAAKDGFEDLFELAGDTLPEVLQNLNELHFRVKTLMPNLNPPRFEVSEQTGHSLKLHYYSSRDGFSSFMIGVLKGLTKKFGLNATLTVLPPVAPGEKCIVSIAWD